MTGDFDWRSAVNTVSDVVQNRPRPLREFDQIYMKTADLVLQSHEVARWSDGASLSFIGDGDAVALSIAYLQQTGHLSYGPRRIVVFDFDERICKGITRFAEQNGCRNIESHLYNCLDAFPMVGAFERFYTNPPWGASNQGDSVKVFAQRGMEAVAYEGQGMIVIAEDPALEWTQLVRRTLATFCQESDFVVLETQPPSRSYHLDDNPQLMSTNVIVQGDHPRRDLVSRAIAKERLQNFYGRNSFPLVRYVRDKPRIDSGRAADSEYYLEPLP